MAYSEANTASRVEHWNREFFSEYVRDMSFRPYMSDNMGKSDMMPIQTSYKLTEGGKTINIPFFDSLTGAGVRGTSTLSGNEEAIGNYNQKLTVNWNRHAVAIKKPERHWTEFDMLDYVRPALKTWAMEGLRDDIICAFLAYDDGSILRGIDADDTTTAARTPLAFYSAYSEAVKDAWLAANADRFLFGNDTANNAANDHSAAMANIDVTNDRMTAAHVSLVKQLAREASARKIKPVKQSVSGGRDDYVYFVGPRAFRDLKRDEPMRQANRDARARDVANNPIFQDGDLIWDGVVIREIPEIPAITGVGASTSDVEPAFFTGCAAVACSWGQRPKSTTDRNDDYGFEAKRGIEECRGTSKMAWNGIQNGVFNTFVSAPATTS